MNSQSESGTKKDENIVFPSHKIGVEEQYLPAKNSSYLEEHEIRASVSGRLFIDKEHYRAKVFPLRKGHKIPQRYLNVIGHVIRVSRSSVRVNVYYLNKKPINPSISAIMHISDASRDYVKNLDEYYAAGDVIRAQIIDAKTYPLQLRCTSRETGVIYTTCLKCGEEVEKIKKNLLKCKECGYKQTRATTIDYGKFSFLPSY